MSSSRAKRQETGGGAIDDGPAETAPAHRVYVDGWCENRPSNKVFRYLTGIVVIGYGGALTYIMGRDQANMW